MSKDPDQKIYGPIIIFLIVLSIIAWEVAPYRLGRH